MIGELSEALPETAQHATAGIVDFPFVMLTVPKYWAVESPKGYLIGGLVEGGAKHPTAELAFAAHTPTRSVRTRRAALGWKVRPATALEVATWERIGS